MVEPLRVGVLGLGFGAAVHVPGLMGIPGVKVVAVGGRDAAKAAVVVSRFGLDPRCSVGGIDALLDRDPDIVTLALPPNQNAAAARKAIEAGCAVLSEKPLAADWREATALVEAARGRAAVTAVDFQFAELPAFRRLAQAIIESRLGQVHHVSVTWLTHSYAHNRRIWSWKLDAHSGGVLVLLGSHVLYLAEWLFGPVAEIWAAFDSAATQSFAPEGAMAAEDLVHLRLVHKSGTTFSACLSNSAPGMHTHKWHVAGSKGSLVLENPTSDYMRGFCLAGTGDASDILWSDDPSSGDGRLPPFMELASRFVAAVGNPGRSAAFSPGFDAGARVQYLMAAAQQSAATRSPIPV